MSKDFSFSYEDLIACAKGKLFGKGNPQLPLPPMLMVDRILRINKEGGTYGKGLIEAEYEVKSRDRWFFNCHFVDDPVMPGCLGLDGLWQLVGFFLGWIGGSGKGRAFGVGAVKFSGMVTPVIEKITYEISLKRVLSSRLFLAIADGVVKADGKVIYEANDLRVGLVKPESAAKPA